MPTTDTRSEEVRRVARADRTADTITQTPPAATGSTHTQTHASSTTCSTTQHALVLCEVGIQCRLESELDPTLVDAGTQACLC